MTSAKYKHETPRKEQVNPVSVKIEYMNGGGALGQIFVKPYQRVLDVMNDDRQFIPFLLVTDSEEVMIIVNKADIKRIYPQDKEKQTNMYSPFNNWR